MGHQDQRKQRFEICTATQLNIPEFRVEKKMAIERSDYSFISLKQQVQSWKKN